jgi:hypothetical protein
VFILPEDKIYFTRVRGRKFSHTKAMAGEGSTDIPSEGPASPVALAARLRENPSPATFQSVLSDLAKLPSSDSGIVRGIIASGAPPASNPKKVEFSLMDLFFALHLQDQTGVPVPSDEKLRELRDRYVAAARSGGRRPRNYKFDRCVKTVRKTVKARKGSKESAAIAICVTSVLHPKGRTLKRYRKGRLLTQKRK